jgi:AcrR family transcriptional regulator
VSPRGAPGQTRQDILDAARSLFGEVGYPRATVRAIARRAHVDPALVIQYFGSKDELLLSCLEMPVDVEQVLEGLDRGPDVGTELVRRALAAWQQPVVHHAVRTLLRTGLSHDRAADALRIMLTRSVLPVVARLAGDDRTELRAALVGTQLAGLALGREVLGVPPLARASVDELAAAVGPTVTRYLTGDLG